MPTQALKKLLDKNQCHYACINHAPSYTASQTAQSTHISGRNMAKVVMVKLDDRLTMITLPANHNLNIHNLKKETNAKKIELAHEYEFNQKFPDCEVGAMPPIGDLYGLDTYISDDLARQEWIAFNAGSHSELLQMPMQEFLKLAHPVTLYQC